MLGLALGLGLGFEPSSPIVRELVLSLTRLSFPLVRFRHNLAKARVMIDVSTLSEKARRRNRKIVVRPHAAQLMIDRTVDHSCLFWPSAD